MHCIDCYYASEMSKETLKHEQMKRKVHLPVHPCVITQHLRRLDHRYDYICNFTEISYGTDAAH